MHIHLPKPLHGWREFLGEVGVIVIGVLIALGLEQAVESIHERRLAREARDAIHQEMQVDVNHVAYRLSQQPCIDRRLDEIATLLAGWHSDDAFAPGLSIGYPGDTRMVDERWQANLASGRFSQESPHEQADQAEVYTAIHALDHLNDQEAQTWNDLGAIESGSRALSPAARPGLATSLARARRMSEAVRQVSNEMLTGRFAPILQRAGVRPNPSYAPATIATVCHPMRQTV